MVCRPGLETIRGRQSVATLPAPLSCRAYGEAQAGTGSGVRSSNVSSQSVNTASGGAQMPVLAMASRCRFSMLTNPDGSAPLNPVLSMLNRHEELRRENQALREQLSRLSQASRRITEDLDTVLQWVVDGARALTEARLGGITTLDEAGQFQGFYTSGLTAEEHRMFLELPGGLEFFAHLGQLAAPLRLSDFSAHTRGLGLPEVAPPLGPLGSFLQAPIRLRSQQLGTIYLSGKAGSAEFSQGDEETLLLFASQAALVISNARRHREERQARADLETLVNTAPVGVVVFDARAGTPLSFKREARRLVDGLRDPEQTPEQLLEALTFRWADGREFSLQEFPVAELLGTGETVRAEEIVLRVPDGRSVSTLVNATPIRSEEGVVASVVVTLQDLTSLGELGRAQAEFLGMVSRELRAPLTSIKGSIDTLLEPEYDLDPAETRQFFRIIRDQSNHLRELVSDLLDLARLATGELSLAPEPVGLAALAEEARRRFVRSAGRDNVSIDLPPDLPPVLADRRRVAQALTNLLGHAARFSPESSVIRVSAENRDPHVAATVAGDGMDPEGEPLLEFSRQLVPAEPQGGRAAGGTGLSLAVSQGIVEAHGGRIWAGGQGLAARYVFTLPAAEGVRSTSPAAAPGTQGRSAAERGQRAILVLEDDLSTLRYVRDALSDAGYLPVVTSDPEELLGLLETERPGLVLLDLAVAGVEGIEMLERVRAAAYVPVVLLAEYGRDQAIARAFELGASDYLVKPFSPIELVARVGAALRRGVEPLRHDPAGRFQLGDLTIDYDRREVDVAGQPVGLTDMGYNLLRELSANEGRALTHEQILRRVWQKTIPGGGQVLIRGVVKNLRRKLGDDRGHPSYIVTELGSGYRMARTGSDSGGGE